MRALKIDGVYANRNANEKINQTRSLAGNLCKGLVAFGHSYAQNKDLLEAGLAFGLNAIPNADAVYGYVSTVVCKNHPSFQQMASNMAGSLVTEYLSNLITPLGWPLQCLGGIGEYISENIISGLAETFLNWVVSIDPNDIVGPQSYGPDEFIWRQEPFVFKIRFENLENASAPAQLVKVSSKVHENLDVRSVRLISFGFNKFSRNFDESLRNSYFSETLEYDSELPSFVKDRYEIRVFGSIDSINREIMWQFKTIDVTTGLLE